MPTGGGRGVLVPYISHTGMFLPPQGNWFLGLFLLFGLKTGIHFAPFGLELGTVFEGTLREYN